jgi:hypothetical protein
VKINAAFLVVLVISCAHRTATTNGGQVSLLGRSFNETLANLKDRGVKSFSAKIMTNSASSDETPLEREDDRLFSRNNRNLIFQVHRTSEPSPFSSDVYFVRDEKVERITSEVDENAILETLSRTLGPGKRADAAEAELEEFIQLQKPISEKLKLRWDLERLKAAGPCSKLEWRSATELSTLLSCKVYGKDTAILFDRKLNTYNHSFFNKFLAGPTPKNWTIEKLIPKVSKAEGTRFYLGMTSADLQSSYKHLGIQNALTTKNGETIELNLEGARSNLLTSERSVTKIFYPDETKFLNGLYTEFDEGKASRLLFSYSAEGKRAVKLITQGNGTTFKTYSCALGDKLLNGLGKQFVKLLWKKECKLRVWNDGPVYRMLYFNSKSDLLQPAVYDVVDVQSHKKHKNCVFEGVKALTPANEIR